MLSHIHTCSLSLPVRISWVLQSLKIKVVTFIVIPQSYLLLPARAELLVTERLRFIETITLCKPSRREKDQQGRAEHEASVTAVMHV